MRRKKLIVLLLPLLMAGCQSYKKVPYLQEGLSQATATETLLYDAHIMPKDLLTIIVSCPEEPALAEPFNLAASASAENATPASKYLVDNNGNIDFPFLGTIHLGGLTKGEAEEYIKSKLSPQFRTPPLVSVRMGNYKISVIGEVNGPGTFTVSNEKVNIFEALAMAGDMTIYGVRDKVKLIREDHTGKREIVTLNLNDRNILQSPYYYLQQNDILYVTPNKTKAKTAGISSSTTIWLSVATTLMSLVSLIISITR